MLTPLIVAFRSAKGIICRARPDISFRGAKGDDRLGRSCVVRPPFVVCAVGFVLFLLGTHARAENSVTIRFEDVTDRLGLGELLERPANNARPWRYAHGAAWGDVDGDDRPDLFLGAFTRPHWFGDERSPSPNMLLLNGAQRFSLHRDETVRAKDQQARCAGALDSGRERPGTRGGVPSCPPPLNGIALDFFHVPSVGNMLYGQTEDY